MLPAAIGNAQRFAQQQRAEAAAIDEEIAFDAAAVLQGPAPLYVRQAAPVRRSRSCLPCERRPPPPHACGETWHRGRRRNDRRSPVRTALLRDCWPALRSGPAWPRRWRWHSRSMRRDRHRLSGQQVLAQPDLVEVDAQHRTAIFAERVNISVPRPAPIDEFDAELERPLRRATNSFSSMPRAALKSCRAGSSPRPRRRCRSRPIPPMLRRHRRRRCARSPRRSSSQPIRRRRSPPC